MQVAPHEPQGSIILSTAPAGSCLVYIIPSNDAHDQNLHIPHIRQIHQIHHSVRSHVDDQSHRIQTDGRRNRSVSNVDQDRRRPRLPRLEMVRAWPSPLPAPSGPPPLQAGGSTEERDVMNARVNFFYCRKISVRARGKYSPFSWY